jgi:Cys-rich repeat protein
MKHTLIALASVALLLTGCLNNEVVSCPNCPSPERDAGTSVGGDAGPVEQDAGGGISCQAHEDCGAQYCVENRCVPCVEDRHCGPQGAGVICAENHCSEGCWADTGCPPSRPMCNRSGEMYGTCQECVADRDCVEQGRGTICSPNGDCQAACGPDRPCPEGDWCEENLGACVDCLDDQHCPAGSICEEYRCAEGCRDDTQCVGGQVCIEGNCAPGCRNDRECGNGSLCIDSHCVEGDCRDANDCDFGELCRANRCDSPCDQDNDCRDGYCDQGACVDGCANDQHCGENAYCENGGCHTGCRDDESCGGGRICVESDCVSGCRNDDQCDDGLLCLDQTCQAGCRADDECPAGFVCSQNSCERRCRNDDSCPDGQICQVENNENSGICIDGCRNDANCGDGSYCADGQCHEGCRNDDHCGDELVCVEGACVVGCSRQNGWRCPDSLVCDRVASTCVQCVENDDCNAPLVCNTDVNRCELQCVRHTDCPGGALCLAGECAACENDNQCADMAGRPYCHEESGCVACLNNGHCAAGQVCDPIRKTCTAAGRFGVCQPDASLGGCNNSNRRCQDGLSCVTINDRGGIQANYCMQRCDNNATCPRGFSCQQSICRPFSSIQQLTCESYAELGVVCNDSVACGLNSLADDAICSGYGRYSNPPRCSWFCGDNNDCPANHSCEDPPPQNGRDPDPRCTPTP